MVIRCDKWHHWPSSGMKLLRQRTDWFHVAASFVRAPSFLGYKIRLPYLAPAVSGCLCLALLTQATSARSDAPATLNAMSYLPSISDFMIATIQPRHVRLWVAARSGDWSFAAYELGNLRGAFDRLGRAHPVEHEIPLQEMISSVTSQPFEDMHKAIESKDMAVFVKAYGDLTSACNACHEATNHGVVVIRAPTDSSISDQDFDRLGP